MPNQYQPLFLKYRPQAISELIGQQQIAATLTNAIKYNRISHAYLFTGPRGTGKTSTARIFAKSLNCEKGPTAEPCQICTSCIEIKQGISPSVFEIDAASNNSVDDARLLIERAPLAACGGRYKLYIIDECHMLTKEAFNALLKTIEEPPANVIFILATTEEHKVLPTIVSRCQKLMFRLINDQAMFDHLVNISAKENIVIEKGALASLANRANGGLRDALSLLDQISLLGGDGLTISTEDVLLLTGALPDDILNQMVGHIFRGETQEVLALLKELFASGREAHLIASELAKYLLNIAKASYGEKQSEKSNLIELSKMIEQSELIQMIEEVDRLEVGCRRSSQPIMNLEIGLLALCQRLDIIQYKAMQVRLQRLEDALGLTADGSITMPKDVVKEKPKVAEVKLPSAEPAIPKVEMPTVSGTMPVQENKANSANVSEPASDKPTAKRAVVEGIEEEIESNSNNRIASSPVQFDEEDSMEMDAAISAANEDKKATAKNGSDKNNIDIAWQNILSELQRRHIPTFSLVSTHAFPIELTDSVLTVGVFVENFQKMIENKAEYIKAAAFACEYEDLKIVVRVQKDDMVASLKKKEINNPAAAFNTISTMPTAPLNMNDEAPAAVQNNNLRADEENQEHRGVKEAYRLFEGPGSRYIAPIQ